MSACQNITDGRGCRRWIHSFAALALAWGGNALAQDVVSVPAAHLHHAEGSVAYAPQGDKEWHDVQPRRVLKRGDRLWVDRGSRAEVQAGGHALRLNGETQLVLENVGETATQLTLTQGSIVATVTRMNPGDSFEVGTPNLAFRARQVGDYRIDVDTRQGVTRVVVLSGLAVVYGEQGEAMEVRSGQRVTFRERRLARVQQPLFAATDDFDRWAGARRRGEPTVTMPVIAQGAAAATPIPRGLVNKGPDIIIKGSAAEVAAQTGIPAHSTAVAAAARASVAAPPMVVARQPAAAAPVAVLAPPAASAKPIPTAVAASAPPASAKPIPTAVAAAPLRVTASSAPAGPTPAQIQAQAQIAQAQAALQAQAQAQARTQAEAEAQAQAAAQAQAHAAAQAQAREQERHQRRVAQLRAEDERRALAARIEQERRAAIAAEARRAEEHRRAVAARRADEDRRHLLARHDAEQKRVAASRQAEEERRHAQQVRRAAEERRLEAMRRADAQKLAELRRQQLLRLQAQAGRDEQSAVLRRAELARKADDERREDQARREEQARREDDQRRQRALAEQARRDQVRRDEEVWLHQQQNQPVRPVPMGVPFRRVS